MLNFKF